MKTLTAPATTEKNKARGKQVRTLLEIDAVGGTLYYSDQHLIVGTQSYHARVLEFGRIESQIAPGDNVVRTSAWRVKVSNNPSIAHLIAPGQEVRGYQWFANLGSADKVPIFRGTIKGPSPGDLYDITIKAEGIGEFHNILIGDLLDPATYPNADPDDWNKMIPEVFGSVKNLPCLWIEAGAVTTLRGDINDVVTTIPVLTTVIPPAFPSSGTIKIGDELITYTGKTDDTFTGATRGGSAVSHSDGDAVLENVATVKGIAGNHKFKSLSNARIKPYNLPVKNAVSVDSFASYTVDDSGQATITLSDLGVIARKVAIIVGQQPAALDDVGAGVGHNHAPVGDLTFDVMLDSFATVSSTGVEPTNWTFPNRTINITDQNLNVGSLWTPVLAPFSYKYKVQRGFVVERNGTPTQIRANFKYAYGGAGIGTNVLFRLYINNVFKQLIGLPNSTSGTSQTNYFSISSWGDISNANTRVEIDLGGVAVGDVFDNLEIWYTVDYTANDTDKKVNVATTGGTEVLLGGDSVADTLGGVLICDAEGWPDDGAGHYTGTPNALIEKPTSVFHKILETYANGPVAHADIDISGSFADALANLPASYEFGFAILEQIELNELLAGLAWQCWCRFVWAPDNAKLLRIRDDNSPIKTIDTDDDSLLGNDNRLQVKFTIPGFDDEGISNDLLFLYNVDYSLGGWGNEKAYAGLKTPSNADSISAYKTRKKKLIAYAIGDNDTMAADVADKFLSRYAHARRTFTFPSTLANMEIEPGDILELTCSQLGLLNYLCEILEVDYTPPVPIQEQGSETLIKLLSLLIANLRFTDALEVSDNLKIDIAVVGSDGVQIGDVAKIDIAVVGSDGAQIGDAVAVNIPIVRAEGVQVGDTLNHVHKNWYFDSSLYFDSTRYFNDTP